MRNGRWARRVVAAALTLLVGFNVYAFPHARAVTHVEPDGPIAGAIVQPGLLERFARVMLAGASARPRNLHTPRDHGLIHSVHRIPLTSGETLEAWHIPHPRARGLVVMFHGFAASKESLLPAAVELHRLGLATLLIDFRGAGGSSGSTTTLGIREADDVAAAVAVHGLASAAVILESPFDRLLTTVQRRFAVVPAPPTPAAEAVLFWGGVQLGVDPFAHNPVDYAAAVTVPTLILHGDRDPWLSLEEARGIANATRAPTRLVAIAGAGHESLVVVAPAVWREAVKSFLASTLD